MLKEEQYFLSFFDLLKQEGSVLKGLLSHRVSLEIQALIKEMMITYSRENLKETITDPIQIDYQSVFMANAIFGVVQYWLSYSRELFF